MADYYTPTVVQPTIPNVDMTPLERLLLAEIFSAEVDEDGFYFFSEDGPSDMLLVKRADLDVAVASSQYAAESTANTYVKSLLEKSSADDAEIDLDLSGTSWEFFLCRYRHKKNYAVQRVMRSDACNPLPAQ